jgi:diketogulonate reductase-like aldo/keto reductase
MQLTLQSRVKLNNGVEMPMLGLGVWQMAQGIEAQRAVKSALDVGYRLIDTAKLYANERDVGIAVGESGIPREEVFVTTKLWNTDHGFESAIKAFNRSLHELGFDYVDLYLIHWPVAPLRGDSWRALVRLLEEGKCRAIGVSNYTVDHLRGLLRDSSVVPAVNQVEFSPFLFQEELMDSCQDHNIQLEAYSPLTKGARLGDPKLRPFAAKYHKTAAQILIRWALQHNVVVIPKSSKPERILENSQVFDFEISSADMKMLDSLGEDYRTAWDPTNVR